MPNGFLLSPNDYLLNVCSACVSRYVHCPLQNFKKNLYDNLFDHNHKIYSAAHTTQMQVNAYILCRIFSIYFLLLTINLNVIMMTSTCLTALPRITGIYYYVYIVFIPKLLTIRILLYYYRMHLCHAGCLRNSRFIVVYYQYM